MDLSRRLSVGAGTELGNHSSERRAPRGLRPGGHRDNGFDRIGDYAFFCNRNENNCNDCIVNGLPVMGACAHECSLRSEDSYFLQDYGHKYRGMSVRCIKDDTLKNKKKSNNYFAQQLIYCGIWDF